MSRNIAVFPSGLSLPGIKEASDAYIKQAKDFLLKNLIDTDSTRIDFINRKTKQVLALNDALKDPEAAISDKRLMAHECSFVSAVRSDEHNDEGYSEALWFCFYVTQANGHILTYGKRSFPISAGDIIVMNARFNHGLKYSGPDDASSIFSSLCVDYTRRPENAELVRVFGRIEEITQVSRVVIPSTAFPSDRKPKTLRA